MSPLAPHRKPSPRQMFIPALFAFVALVVLSLVFISMHSQSTSTQRDTARSFRSLDAASMEKQLRSDLPIGTPSKDVIEYLSDRRVEFSLNSETNTVSAIIRKPSTWQHIIGEADSFEIHFDGNLKLQSINFKKPYLTGP